jgi:hypothetical protein
MGRAILFLAICICALGGSGFDGYQAAAAVIQAQVRVVPVNAGISAVGASLSNSGSSDAGPAIGLQSVSLSPAITPILPVPQVNSQVLAEPIVVSQSLVTQAELPSLSATRLLAAPAPTSAAQSRTLIGQIRSTSVSLQDTRLQIQALGQLFENDNRSRAPGSGNGLVNSGFRETDREAGGSNDGRWFQDSRGQYYFGKTADSDWLAGQHLATQLYRLFGISAPVTHLVSIQGKPYLMSKELPGHDAGTERSLARTDAAKGFIIDTWLANWDVLGNGYIDNILADGKKAHRIDAGGALVWRGQGERKPSFKAKVREIYTMRDGSGIYSDGAGRFFQRLTDAQVAGQIRRFKNEYEQKKDRIDALVDSSGLSSRLRESIRKALHARARWLMTEGWVRVDPDAVVGNEHEGLEAMGRIIGRPSNPNHQGVYVGFEEIGKLRGNPAVQRHIRKLTDDEVAVIKSYTGGGFMALNEAMWFGLRRDLKAYRPFIAILKSGLRKLPDYKGIAWRVAQSSNHPWSSLRAGRTITARGFWSSSLHYGVAPYDGDLVFKIISKHGKRIDFINEGEEEVLFAAGSQFRVVKREIVPDPTDLAHEALMKQVVLREL